MSTIKLSITESADLAKILQQVDVEVRGKAMRRGIKSAAKIVVDDAKRRVSQSRLTGTREHNSLAYRNKYGNPPKPLRQTIGQLERTYRDGAILVGIVGAKRPAGSHGHLVEQGHKAVYWGRVGADRDSRKVNIERRTVDASDAFKSKRRKALAKKIGLRRQDRRQKHWGTVIVGGSKSRVEGKKWLAPAVDTTMNQQDRAMKDAIRDGIVSAGG